MHQTTEPLQPEFRYDEVPYESHAYSATHPDHLAMMGRLFGIATPDPERARVLEIGSASGGNIVPIAALFPQSQCIGFDLSRVEIEEGKQRLAALGIRNVELRHANIMDVDESWGTFDYILCHGVWSWVPGPVQDRIFELCRKHLSPNGVAYISYNVYPGWRLRQMIRDMMLYHVQGFETPKEKTQQARALLDFLANVHGAKSTHPYVTWLRQEADLLRSQPDSYLYHDHLSDMNEPVYFHEFVDRARTKGLVYLADSQFSTMLAMHMPGGARGFLEGIGDLEKVEQYMDFVRQRAFRTSLMVRGDVEINRNLDWTTMVNFHYGCRGTFESGNDDIGNPDVEMSVRFPGDSKMATKEPVMKGGFRVMLEEWPRTVHFEDLLKRSRALYEPRKTEQEDREELGGLLLSCLANDVVEVRTTAVGARRASERPVVFPWARAQIKFGTRYATNLRHEIVALDPMVRQVLWMLDGEHTRDQVLDKLVEHALGGGVEVHTPDGNRVDTPEGYRKAFEEAYEHSVSRAEELSLLVG